ncbi:poly-gamma-glutamate biosynthesis protein PgsC [Marine Group I thaumarchaeote]|uniref:Poly-gamma-glutamate biosynthesis protein PgsC n=2 Tax=root TaxID=1 RepID=A0A7K4MS05_9ARCH|nr:poly-gamma-glutamate biosynthesis protein PgsC [Marine Group I thaumarchaeote]
MISEPGIYIGIGMVLSLFLTETLGVTAGGIIVPGYIAMNLENPERLVITFGISIITFLLIKLLGQFIMVYGKRSLVLALLIGFLLGYLTRSENNLVSSLIELDFVVIGNIIPGLIANWMDRQGVLRTICTVLITAGVTKLIIMTVSIFSQTGIL